MITVLSFREVHPPMGALRPLRQGVRLRQCVDCGIWNRTVRGAWDARVAASVPGNASRIG